MSRYSLNRVALTKHTSTPDVDLQNDKERYETPLYDTNPDVLRQKSATYPCRIINSYVNHENRLMSEILRDPLWTFVGAVLAVLAVVVTIFIYFAQRKIKKLSYEIISNTQLLGVKDEIQGKVKVLYNDEEVKNVHLLTVRFLNAGNQSIVTSDYERPVSIGVNANAKILTYEILEQDPSNIGATLYTLDNKIMLNSVLLNAKDSFCIKTLISDLEGNPKIDGRINGVKEISKITDGQVSFIITALISFVFVGFGALNLESKELVHVFGVELSKSIVGGSLFGLGYILMIFTMVKNKRTLKLTQEIFRAILKAKIT
jgi:hypothetical protein